MTHHFVIFYMHGVERPFEYAVAKETSARIRESLEEEDPGNLVFEAYRPAEQIVINSRLMQLAHFRWQPDADADLDGAMDRDGGGHERPGGGNGGDQARDRENTVYFYFSGRETPIKLVTDDPEEVFDLVLAMQTEAFPRCSIVDADGEESVLDIRKLVCAEFPLGLAHRGEAQALFEVGEEV